MKVYTQLSENTVWNMLIKCSMLDGVPTSFPSTRKEKQYISGHPPQNMGWLTNLLEARMVFRIVGNG